MARVRNTLKVKGLAVWQRVPPTGEALATPYRVASPSPSQGGCRFDYHPTPGPRRSLRCAVHPRCPIVVTLWRPGILGDLGARGLLVGDALVEYQKGSR